MSCDAGVAAVARTSGAAVAQSATKHANAQEQGAAAIVDGLYARCCLLRRDACWLLSESSFRSDVNRTPTGILSTV